MDNNYYVKLPLRSKVCYGLVDTADAFSWSFISSFLMIFYTDVFVLDALAVAVLFLVARIWDAVNDPIVGILSDRTRTRLGRYRPWILGGALPLAICTVLVFWAHPEWPQGSKLIYAYVTYGLVVLAYTCVNIPYTALAASMTQDPGERASLASYRIAFALVGAVITSQIGVRLVPVIAGGTGDYVRGYLLTVVLLVGMGLPLYLLAVKNTREVIIPAVSRKKIDLPGQMKVCLRNKSLLMTIFAHFLVGLSIYGRMAVVTYYFKYNVGDQAMVATFFLFMQIPMMFGSFGGRWLANLFRNKGRGISVCFGAYGVLSVVNLWVDPSAPLLFWGLLLVANLFYGGGYSLTYAIIPDAVEVNELRTGQRNDGVVASLTTFWNKVGMAIGTSATAAVLGALNYVPNSVQSVATLSSINFITFGVPGIAAIIVAVIFIWYKLDYTTFNQVTAQLNAQKNGDEQRDTI